MHRALILQSLMALACLLTEARVRADFISYINPAKINDKTNVGNQGFGGSLGMDFRTLDPISITQLGVFDSGLQGFAGLTDKQSITVAIFDTKTQKEVTPEITFTKKDPGTLDAGSRFKTLKTPVKIDAGEDLTVVAWGFTANQKNGNYYLDPFSGKGNTPWTTNSNGGTPGWLAYVGTGRYGPEAKPGAFPTTVENNKPPVPNPYEAGTFKWIEGPFGNTPEPSSFVLATFGGLGMVVAYGWRKCRGIARAAGGLDVATIIPPRWPRTTPIAWEFRRGPRWTEHRDGLSRAGDGSE